MKTKSALAERIKAARGRESQDIFAAKIGLSRATLSLYERGASQPNAEVLRKICDFTTVSPAWLLLGQGPMRLDEAPVQDDSGILSLPLSIQEHIEMAEARLQERLRAHEKLAERERVALLKSIEAKDETIHELREHIALCKEIILAGKTLPGSGIVQEGTPAVQAKMHPAQVAKHFGPVAGSSPEAGPANGDK